MPKIIVLPTQEDTANFACGRKPENHFLTEFDTDAEGKSYSDAVGSLGDLQDYEILAEDDLTLTVEIDGEENHIPFETSAEKDAYKLGLEHADGFVEPEVYLETDEKFAELERLVGPSKLELYKYDSDISVDCWAVDVEGQTIYVLAERNHAGKIEVEINNGYEPGSDEHAEENRLFSDNEPAIRAAAEIAVAGLEEEKSDAPPAP